MTVMTAKSLVKRGDIPSEQTWKRESVFDSWDAFQQELDAIAAQLPEFQKYVGTLGSSPDALLAWLEAYTRLRRRVYRLMTFTRMATAVDATDAEAKAKNGQVTGLIGRLNAADRKSTRLNA